MNEPNQQTNKCFIFHQPQIQSNFLRMGFFKTKKQFNNFCFFFSFNFKIERPTELVQDVSSALSAGKLLESNH